MKNQTLTDLKACYHQICVDKKAFDAFVLLATDDLQLYIQSVLPDLDKLQIKTLAGQTFDQLWMLRNELPAVDSPLIVTHQLFDIYRQEVLSKGATMESMAQYTYLPPIDDMLRFAEKIDLFLNKLSPDEQSIFNDITYEKKDWATVGKSAKMSAATVKIKYQQIRKRLLNEIPGLKDCINKYADPLP